MVPGKTNVGTPATTTVNSAIPLFVTLIKTSCDKTADCAKTALIVPKTTGVFIKEKPFLPKRDLVTILLVFSTIISEVSAGV